MSILCASLMYRTLFISLYMISQQYHVKHLHFNSHWWKQYKIYRWCKYTKYRIYFCNPLSYFADLMITSCDPHSNFFSKRSLYKALGTILPGKENNEDFPYWSNICSGPLPKEKN